MSKKFLAGIITVVFLTSVLTISVFAGTAEGLKATRASLKESNTLRQQRLDSLRAKAEERRAELGIVRLTEEQKTQLKALRDQLVPLKDQVTTLKAQLAAAIVSKDAATVKSIRAQLEEIRTSVTAICSQIVAITGGKKDNIEEIKVFRTIIKGAHDQKAPIIEAAKLNIAEIKALYAELKAARLSKNEEDISRIIDSLIAKLNVQKSNFEHRTSINNVTSVALD